MSADFGSEAYWEQQWAAKLAAYHAAPPRAGLFIRRLLGASVRSVLELGAGSARDSLWLSQQGYRCTASDFSSATIDVLTRRFASPTLRFSVDDSRELRFGDGEFDLVFHNGLIVCFDSDADVQRILREQRRVARRYMLILAHNAENERLRRTFAQLGEKDDLYRIRFFSRADLGRQLREAGIAARRIRMLKFGGPADALFSRRIRGVPNPLVPLAAHCVPSLYALQPWRRVERIACLVEI